MKLANWSTEALRYSIIIIYYAYATTHVWYTVDSIIVFG